MDYSISSSSSLSSAGRLGSKRKFKNIHVYNCNGREFSTTIKTKASKTTVYPGKKFLEMKIPSEVEDDDNNFDSDEGSDLAEENMEEDVEVEEFELEECNEQPKNTLSSQNFNGFYSVLDSKKPKPTLKVLDRIQSSSFDSSHSDSSVNSVIQRTSLDSDGTK